MRFVPRTALPHDIPPWVPTGALYFITIHCAADYTDLTTLPTANAVLASVRHYHEHHRWFARLFLLMPDHVHALLSFPKDQCVTDCVRAWKQYLARTEHVRWQRDFFEHRIRDDENWEEKASYIRMNPVRKGLVPCAAEWPWVFEPR